MPTIGDPEKKKILVVVKTYPTPATKGVEVSCTAGITEDGQWIRLFPIPYRFLHSDQRFSKYELVEVEVAKSSDSRPESYEVNVESLKILSGPLPTHNGWQSRREALKPLTSHCLCCLKESLNRDKHPTLGFYKPKRIKRLLIEEDDPNWSESDLGKLSQTSMFDNAPPRILEKIPYKFRYEVSCDEQNCRGHSMICTDWELIEAYRRWKVQYPDAWEDKLRQKFEYEMVQRNDTHLFVGTVRSHPASWIIVGLFYPPKNVAYQQTLPLE